MDRNRYVLFCAGEESGDVLGESLVLSVVAQGWRVRGTGGMRMQAAGLEPVGDFEELPVSGFGDVLPRYLRLRQIFAKLVAALDSPECRGLVAIDYPGFNLRLCAQAKRLKKPILYVAPPQVWAWKSRRARKLRDVSLAVLFDFERAAYERFGCHAVLLRHPFLPENSTEAGKNVSMMDTACTMVDASSSSSPRVLLLPGSREKQALRNLGLYLRVALRLREASDFSRDPRAVENPEGLPSMDACGQHQTFFFEEARFVIVAARETLIPVLERRAAAFFGGICPGWIRFEVAPASVAERRQFYADAWGALTLPGTATLELALSGCPQVVATVPDALTYSLGRLLVRTRYFAMPNLLCENPVIEEFILKNAETRNSSILNQIASALRRCRRDEASLCASMLRRKLAVGESSANLMLEFLRQLV